MSRSKKSVFFLAGVFSCLLLPAPVFASSQLDVLSCEPEWAALVNELAGELADIKSATTVRQDPHHITAKPSLIAAMRRAKLLVCSGADLEVGWLPTLLEKAGNGDVAPGSNGYLMIADVITLQEKPASVDRSQGDVHPQGNPHSHLDPRNIALAANTITARLLALDPTHAAQYKQKNALFIARWQQALAGWQTRANALKGMKLVSHHSDWVYLATWLQLDMIATLEPLPGVPPTPSHLQKLLALMRDQKVSAIVRTPFEPADASDWLSQKTGAPALILPYSVDKDSGVPDLFALFDKTLQALEKINTKTPPAKTLAAPAA